MANLEKQRICISFVPTLKQQLLGLTKCFNKPLCDDTQIKHIPLDGIHLSQLAKLLVFQLFSSTIKPAL
jgi:hypothetical protein